MEKMFEVGAKCGHVGRNYYIEKIFAVKALDGKAAAAKVRQTSRVKHDHKDAILYVKPIDEARYWQIIHENQLDPYFSCRNVQEQRKLCQTIPRIAEQQNTRRVRNTQKNKKPNESVKRMSSSVLFQYFSDDMELVS